MALPKVGTWITASSRVTGEQVTGEYRGLDREDRSFGYVGTVDGLAPIVLGSIKVHLPTLWFSPTLGLIRLSLQPDGDNYLITVDGSYSRTVKDLPVDAIELGDVVAARRSFALELSDELLTQRDRVRGKSGSRSLGLEEAAGIARRQWTR